MKTEDLIQSLKSGNERFSQDSMNHKLQNQSRRDELVKGQNPKTIVLSCADSRVVPELAFDVGLGELFVVRVAGNVANTDSIASIEYAVANLKSSLIIVLGHQNCGAVTAAIAGGDNGYNLNHLLSQITPAVNACEKGINVNVVVKKNAELVAEDLKSRSSIISNAVQNGELTIKPAYYNLDSGKVDFL